MPKALCIFAMVVAVLVLLLFLADLLLTLLGAKSVAPFYGASLLLDIVFSVSAALVGLLSWMTFREQV